MSFLSDSLWTSKLGNKYPREEIERRHEQTKRELDKLRRSPKDTNFYCADCGQGGTVWSSVNLGVFLCLRCGSLHRALGTHISKPKGCTGTYLWGPDELERMYEVGNARANATYGGQHERPSKDASDGEWMQYLRQKYEEKKFAPKPRDNSSAGSTPISTSEPIPVVGDLIDLASPVEPNAKDSKDFFAEFGL